MEESRPPESSEATSLSEFNLYSTEDSSIDFVEDSGFVEDVESFSEDSSFLE